MLVGALEVGVVRVLDRLDLVACASRARSSPPRPGGRGPSGRAGRGADGHMRLDPRRGRRRRTCSVPKRSVPCKGAPRHARARGRREPVGLDGGAAAVRAVAAARGTARADVAIVGGGFTGVSTAWHLARALPRPPHRAARGARARQRRERAQRRPGAELDQRRRAATSPSSTRRDLRRARSSGIDADRAARARARARRRASRATAASRCSTSAARAEAAHARRRSTSRASASRCAGCRRSEVGARRRARRDARSDRRPRQRARAAARLRAGAARARRRGLRVRRRCCASREGRDVRARHARRRGARRRRRARDQRLHAVARLLPRRGILPLHSHVLATAPLADETWRAIGCGAHDGFSDDLDRIAYGCRTPTAACVFGGGGNAAYAYRFGGAPAFAGAPASAARALRRACARRLRALLPGARATCAIAHRWTGTLDLTLRPRLLDGRARRRTATSTTRSATAATASRSALLAGRVLADLYAGDHEPWRDLPVLPDAPAAHPARAAALARLPGLHAPHGQVAAAPLIRAPSTPQPIEAALDGGEDRVDLVVRDDQRRRQRDQVADAAHDHALLARERRAP